MRVVIAPGSFGPELTAVEAARAIVCGWHRQAPGDVLVELPVSDGGAGFVDVVQASLGGTRLTVPVVDAWESGTSAIVLVVGETAYVEAAQVQAGGLPAAPGVTAEQATSGGVGQLVAAAIDAGFRRVVLGVGTTGIVTNDGGAGLLAALGAAATPADALRHGPAGLRALTRLDLAPAHQRVSGVEIVLATDDEAPLLGLLGTTNLAGPGRGLTPEQVASIDHTLERFAGLMGGRLALTPGAGAGGGIGFGLLALGARKAPGLATVLTEIGLTAHVRATDLVMTGERAFDLRAGSGHVVTGVAAVAGAAVRPCVALAERVGVGARETRALGIESSYGMTDLRDDDPAKPLGERLADLAARVARSWSWTR